MSTLAIATAREVFDRYSDQESDDYDFSRTHVPLALAKYGKDQLVSRSQAKRVLARFESLAQGLKITSQPEELWVGIGNRMK